MKLVKTLAAACAVLSLFAAGEAFAAGKAVLFFSMDDQIPAGMDATTAATGPDVNTAAVASILAQKTAADLVRLELSESYPAEGKVLMDQVVKMRKEGTAVRHFKNEDLSLDGYDTLYIGFPVWKHHPALEIDSFLKERAADLKGKRIYLFGTSQHAKFNEVVADMQKQFPDLNLIEGYSLKLENTAGYENDIAEFAQQSMK